MTPIRQLCIVSHELIRQCLHVSLQIFQERSVKDLPRLLLVRFLRLFKTDKVAKFQVVNLLSLHVHD
jgi:hypothetical protein